MTTLNCKPNRMAMIVKDFGYPEVRALLGRTMTVTTIAHIDPEIGAIWNLAEPIDYNGNDTFSMCGDLVLMMIDGDQPDDSDNSSVKRVCELESIE